MLSRLAEAHAAKGRVETAVLATEAIVHRADAIQAHADIVVADLGDAIGGRLVDQGTVGGKAGIEAHRLGALRDVENVRAQQRLAAGKDQHRHTEGAQIVHHLEKTCSVVSSPGKSTSAESE